MYEPFILWIFESIFDVKRERQVIKGIVLSEFVVLLQVVKHRLFVTQKEVVFKVVVHQNSVVGYSV